MGALVGLTLVSASPVTAVNAAALPELPTLTISPDCNAAPDENANIQVSVYGSGFTAGENVALYSLSDAGYALIPPEPNFGNPVTVNSQQWFQTYLALEIGTQSIEIDAFDVNVTPAVGVPPLATAYLQVPCQAPTITLSQDCASANEAFNLTITGTGFETGVPITFTVSGTSVTDTQTPADGNNVSETVSVTLPGTGMYAVEASQELPQPSPTAPPILFDRADPSATAYIAVPCAEMVMSPTCITTPSTAFPLQLVGGGFQPGLSVGIVFDPTIADPAHPISDHQPQPEYYDSVVAADDGTWSAEIDPYARGPGTYDVMAVQSNDGPFHRTFALTPLTIADPSVGCPTGTLTPNPTCAPPLLNGETLPNFPLTVHGDGFTPGAAVSVTFDGSETSSPTQVAADGTFDASFPNGVAPRPYGAYPITATVAGSLPVTIQFSMPCVKPAPKITKVKPTCGADASSQPPPSPYSIQIVGKGFIPGAATITFDATGSKQQFSATADDGGALNASFTANPVPAGPIQSFVEQSDANGTLLQAPFKFTVPCAPTTNPTIRISPDAVAPGFVVTVHGDGFAPGATIALFWSYGIGAGAPIPVTAAADGTFDRQVLIFAHDFSGSRDMTAGTTANPSAFPGATATLLVTAGQGSPPGYSITGGSPSDELPIVTRR